MHLEVLDFESGISGVRLHGRLDVAGAAAIETRLLAATVARGQPALVDLTGVEFVASMGIGLLIACAKGLALKQCRLALYGANPMVGEVLAQAGLGHIMAVCDTEEDARQRVRG